MIIRREEKDDYRAVEELIREAFWNNYAPGCSEHYLAHKLRVSESFIKELDMVAVVDGRIVGNIMYTHAEIACDNGGRVSVICFGPLSVSPELQGRGVGEKLIQHTKALAKKMGHKAIVICGDPAYYSRFGFVPAEAYDVAMPGNVYADSLQVLDLTDEGLPLCHGIFMEDKVFRIDEEDVEAFDRDFTPKEKLSGVKQQERLTYLLTQQRERKIQ